MSTKFDKKNDILCKNSQVLYLAVFLTRQESKTLLRTVYTPAPAELFTLLDYFRIRLLQGRILR